MKFVAPEQAPEQAEIIRNTPFWPNVDLIGVLMLAINWYYKHKAYQLLRDGQISREDYESINR